MTKKEGQLLEYNILITLILMKIHPVLRESLPHGDDAGNDR